jgi:hypothetical protein
MNVARLLPAIIVLIPVAALAQRSSPAATVTAFYNYDRTHSQVLTRGNINARIRWLTADFVRELREEEVREAAESKLHPDMASGSSPTRNLSKSMGSAAVSGCASRARK